jgi:outer membrane protein assembly factor BamB
MDAHDETEFAFRLDSATGELRWRVPIGPIFKEINGDGPRSTPTIDEGFVFFLGSRGRLVALDIEEGAIVWELSLPETFGGTLPTWAFTSAPLLDGDRLIVEAGGSEDRAVAALDKNTGEVQWTSQEANLSYSSPIRVDFEGHPQYVFLLQQKLVGLAITGEELWSVPFEPRVDIKPATPLFVAPDLILASASYDVGAKVVQLRIDEGKVTAEELWSGRQMRNHFNAGVAVDGYVYAFDTATLRCLDARTGERRWAKRGLGKGSLIYADGMLIVLAERGQLVLVEANSDEYREVASPHPILDGRSWTPPALSDGRLYVRNHSEMVSVDLRSARGGSR